MARDYNQEYEYWLASGALSGAERAELEGIRGDDAQIKDRFFAPLAFGTAGLRGVMGAGLNRMNVHVVRHTTQAMANLVAGEGAEACERGVAVCHDSRNLSREFAVETARVLAANGIKVRLFEGLRPTPELSFAIRHYGCTAGINITASHNPKEYNGYKVYWSDGAQMPPRHADIVCAERDRTDMFAGPKLCDFDSAAADGLIVTMGKETDDAYLDAVMTQSVSAGSIGDVAAQFRLVYTPFHGAGHILVPEALARLGIKNVLCVAEQMTMDGDFPTVKSPNPEDKAGFALAIALAKENGADLIIGTDPDCDRAGIILRDRGSEYITLSGNQVGVLLLDYLIRARREAGTLPEKPAALKTVVTTEMARAVARAQGVDMFDTFTGFKFLAEKIYEFERTGSHKYIFAYEESYGYLAGDHCRDKDAVVASMLIAEMACWYAAQNMTLYDAMEALYEKYGFYGETTLNLVMPGLSGMEKMAALMKKLRENPPESVGGAKVRAVRDYLPGVRTDRSTGTREDMELRGSDVIYLELDDGTSFIVRPSGTEPKVKVYILAKGATRAKRDEKLRAYAAFADTLSA
ncbi:MAG: phospho-sugar mutase [Oscillospiraceae bacterium]|jgi:phosphoglucomutase|nr:phospho-sugar mutase [Oscillospiraceae bacterium]